MGSFFYGLEYRLDVSWKVEALPRLFPVQETDVVLVLQLRLVLVAS